uniref:Uncharacterized protein n=2 Tax=Cacopsylla melanoneura TaxID=428564 RepID=A0A8D8VT54_9HEMI
MRTNLMIHDTCPLTLKKCLFYVGRYLFFFSFQDNKTKEIELLALLSRGSFHYHYQRDFYFTKKGFLFYQYHNAKTKIWRERKNQDWNKEVEMGIRIRKDCLESIPAKNRWNSNTRRRLGIDSR